MRGNKRVVYSNGNYEVYFHKNFRGSRKFRIINTRNKNLHTHRNTKKESIDLANFAKHRNIPRDASIDYLTSLYRIAEPGRYRREVKHLIEVKIDKKRGNKNVYINNTGMRGVR